MSTRKIARQIKEKNQIKDHIQDAKNDGFITSSN